MTELPCRRCGQVTPNRVTIYGSDQAGSLVAKAAQCRGPCPGGTAQPARQARPERAGRRGSPAVFTSVRPGLCAAGCGLDIVPGDRIVRADDDHYHEACAPEVQPRHRERTRTRPAEELQSP